MSPLVLLSLLACSSHEETTGGEQVDPQLTITAPAAGDWVSDGNLTVTGQAQDMESVEAGGVPAELSGEGFEGSVALTRGINVVEASGVGVNGDSRYRRNAVIAGDFADPDGPVRDALMARLNRAGLEQILGLADGLLDLDALLGDLNSLNPILEDTVDVWGFDLVTYRADLVGLDLGTPVIELEPNPGYLTLTVNVPDLSVDIGVSSDVLGLEFDIDAWMGADNVEVVADAFVDAEDGGIVLELGDADVTMQGFSYDTSLLPDWIESWLFVDTIQSTIEDMVVEQIETQVPPLVSGLLDELALELEIDLLGNPLSLSAGFSDVWVDDDGIGLAADVDISMPASGELQYAGYLTAPSTGSPSLSTSAPMAAAMSDDLLNRLLFEVWRAGVLNLAVDSSDPDMGAYIGLLLEMLKAEEGGIAVSAGLPPVMVERAGTFEIQTGELQLTINTPGGELGESLTISTGLFMGLELGLVDNCLELDLGEPELSLMVRESDWGATDEATTRLLEEMLPMDTLLSAVDLLLGDGFCDLLPLEGITLKEVTMERASTGAHTIMEIQLEVDGSGGE